MRASAASEFDNTERRAWTNPETGAVSRDSFGDLYKRALDRAPVVAAAVLSRGFDDDAACALTGNLNYEGAPAPSDAPLA